MFNPFYYILISILWIISFLPLSLWYKISTLLSFLLRNVFRYRKSVVDINLARAFPKLRYKEIAEISKKSYLHMSDIFVETIHGINTSRREFLNRYYVENPEVLEKIYLAGKSCIIVAGHKGNWEVMPSLPFFSNSRIGFKSSDLIFLYKKLNSKISDNLFLWIRYRHKLSLLLESGDAPRYMIKHKDQQRCYVLIADQSPGPGSKFTIKFLNQPTQFINGPEQLSKALKIPAVYMNMFSSKRGEYRINFELISIDPEKEEKGFIIERFAQLLERDIKDNPHEWLWSHKRWKRKIVDYEYKN